MWSLLRVLVVLALAPSSFVVTARDNASTDAPALALPGDAFLRDLAGDSVPKFATRIPLAAASATTRRQLALFRTAALASASTKPVEFLDRSRQFSYPVFGRCSLGKDNNVLPFDVSTTLGPYFESIFRMIPAWTNGDISLSRFDLFHGHLFANAATKTAGVVFHSKEYPADNADTFPYNLGFCQLESNLPFVDKVMRKRNLVWTIDANQRTSFWWIDMAAKSGNGLVDEILGGAPFYTLYEGNLGHVVADFYYLKGLELGVSLY
ncbi:hypothetical protein DRE_07355 [Drechslerella stenobrocha 248]|uniref:Uncharacterized protein n=1 Tax=Drechslerella stenobrocha 248 TaxID=1043628 RepID=W7HUK0_9PEZI|nr:hypothetical protein DRE_07355 [Drechslerella stenobrocha 248]